MEKEIFDVISSCIKDESDFDGTISENTCFVRDGFDSLEIVEIVMECEKRLDVSIPNNLIYDRNLTIEGLCKYIENQRT